MSFKTRIIIKLTTLFIAGGVITVLGAVRGGQLTSMGITMLVVAAVLTVRFALTAANKNKLAALETDSHDERTAFVVSKSYSFSFWVSLVAEFVAVCVLYWFKMDLQAVIISYIICFQALTMAAAYLFYNKN